MLMKKELLWRLMDFTFQINKSLVFILSVTVFYLPYLKATILENPKSFTQLNFTQERTTS
jgi:hypothetical protein